jgi:hypothetical protein
MEGIDYLRATNVVLASVGFVWLLSRTFLRRAEYTHAVTLFLLTLSFYVFGVALASEAMIAQDVERGPWSYAWGIANLALLTSLGLTHKRRPLSKSEGE